MAITEKQKHDLKKFVKELEQYRGLHTELVTVYIPAGYELSKVMNHLFQEKGTASNIKSTSTRKNVEAALERMIQHLRLFKQTPPNGLAAFSGNIASAEGKNDVRVWSIEPPVPLSTRIYRCDKTFVLEGIADMVSTKEVFGLVVLDRRDANIALLRGKTIIPLKKTHSEVPGKMRAGGQCLVPDAVVQLADGNLPKIHDMHNPHVVKSVLWDEGFSIADSPVTAKWQAQKNTIYTITTKNPRLEVQSSKDHVFFTATDEGIREKTAEDLQEGDCLIMPEKITVHGTVQNIDAKRYYNSFMITQEGQNLLKQKRVGKGLLQRQLAKKPGLTQTTVSYHKIGKNHIKAEALQQLCTARGISSDDFLHYYTTPYLYHDVHLPTILNEEFAQFLGYLIGDGSIEKDRITFFEQRKEVALAYQEKFSGSFQMAVSYRFRESKNYHQLRFTSRPLVRLIIGEFPEIKKSLDSEIPVKVLQSPDKVVASFLRGMFDADGYVHTKRGVSLGINNKRLAQQIQLTLLRFSILSSLQEYDNRRNQYSKKPRFTVDICEGKSLEIFTHHIGLTSSEKMKKLEGILASKSDASYSRQIIASGRKVRELIEKAGYNLQSFPKVNNFFRNERMMSKQIFKNSILARIKDKKRYQQLKEIYNYPILPVKINKIEKTSKAVNMVDISVKNQNFIANGVLVHNSAARFASNRELAAKAHFKKVADYMKDQFFNDENLKGIIIGGPGPTKYEFVEGDFITNELKKKIIAIKDITYTDDFGLNELVEKSEDILASESIIGEKKIMQKFFNLLATKQGMVAYGVDEVMKAVKNGVVDVLLISDVLEDAKIEEFEAEAKKMGTEVQIISTETTEGVQLKAMGKVAAILRYEMHQ